MKKYKRSSFLQNFRFSEISYAFKQEILLSCRCISKCTTDDNWWNSMFVFLFVVWKKHCL